MDLMDPVSWLAQKYEERRESNPHFSLRSFAKYVDLPPSTISQILNGKRTLTFKTAAKVANKLCCSEEERTMFLKSFVHSPQDSKDRRYRTLSLDQYKVIQEWYHLAILSMCKLKDSKSDPKWIASRLGINAHQARLALDRLVRLELVTVENGSLKQSGRNIATPNDVASDAVKFTHQDYLKIIQKSIFEVDVMERDMSCLNIAFNKEQLPKAKKMLSSFRRHFAEVTETENSEEIYSLCLYFFPLTKKKERTCDES